ncbi:adenylate/guanylate cyclase domain-containing protein [Rufibacter tibetensis]|uniref:Guanylate cyclase n=1 Tax=Rufibacter tibetensis TaxID=512763 RepID=A0A0P0CDE2_9BACT|nr:adenylate/guanylate cyclase domain-containing protein [Rufibacter tibetensis]ALJ01709.1 hypothetical protein DC20_21925 [Rufibacter tibetensis]
MKTVLHENANCLIFLEEDASSAAPVAVKVLKKEYPDPEEIFRLNNEFNLLPLLQVEGVRKVLRKTERDGRLALALEYIDGQPLHRLPAASSGSLPQFLSMAVQIAGILSEIHRQGIIHLDLHKSNILCSKGGRITIIDFGSASKFDVFTHHLENPEAMHGNLSYISPEQTGRMNRVVDFRSDLYSLGIVFYEMLTGQVPFVSDDPLELVHFHLAKKPVPPRQVNEAVPEVLSDIVVKLLAKNVEERYQTAFGLQHDLQTCLDRIDTLNRIEPFTLATKDMNGRLVLPQKLYGRDKELDRLTQIFSRVAGGAVELFLIGGEPGVGKSALVYELHRHISVKRGFFISGKFEQFQRNIPYYALRNALNGWVRFVLTERDEKLRQWKQEILSAVGDLGQVIVNLIPDLELIIGKQPPLPELGPQETLNRFNYVFRSFSYCISRKEHPLVIFIDDLHWIDPASVELLKIWLTDQQNGYLLLIGAFRDNEVNETHALRFLLKELEKERVATNYLPLQKLSLQDVEQLTADALHASHRSIEPLAEFLFQKTKGNAIFLKQFLESLYMTEKLWLDQTEQKWRWDITALNRLLVSDNVIDLMEAKIKKLPEETRKILTLASCIGNSFDLEDVRVIAQVEVLPCFAALLPGVEEGLVLPMTKNFRHLEAGLTTQPDDPAVFKFIHDRVQQAFYQLIPEDVRQEVHLRIGRLLSKHLSGQQLQERIFDLVYHLNAGLGLVQDKEEQTKLVGLNQEAGKKALESLAFSSALDYLETGLHLLPQEPWQTHYELTYRLYSGAAEAAYLSGEYPKMQRYIEEVLQNTREALEQRKGYMLRIDYLTSQNKLQEGLVAGLEFLGKLDIVFPKNPKLPHIIFTLLKTKWLLHGKRIEDLEHLPIMTNPNMIAALPVLERIVPSAYMSGSNLFPLIVFKMVELSVIYGNMPYSAFGYASFGISLSAVLSDYSGGYRFGQMALRLVERFDSEEYKVKVLFVTDCFLNHWKQHLSSSIQPLLESFQSGLRVGNLVGGTWSAYYHLLLHFYTGMELREFSTLVASYVKTFQQLKQEAAEKRLVMLGNVAKNLSAGDTIGVRLDEEKRGEEEILQFLRDTNDKTSLYFFYCNKLLLYLLGNEPEKGLEQARHAQRYVDAVAGLPELTHFVFYESLALLHTYLNKGSEPLLNQVKKRLAKLKGWSRTSPDNYLHKYEIIKAAWTALTGKQREALQLFDLGLQHAHSQKFRPDEAMGYEIAGRCFLHTGLELLGQTMLSKASAAYSLWGAHAKAAMLQRQYPFIPSISSLTTDTPVSNYNSRSLDLNTLMLASTTISGEIKLEKLLKTMLLIVLKNAGAERGALVMEENGKYHMRAEGTAEAIQVLEKVSLEAFSRLPESVIRYCLRTGEDVVIHDAAEDDRFSTDQYIQQHRPKSILCSAILMHGKTKGLLYLENNLSTNAFTSNRVELLKLLSGQIAISLDNALLYNNLEQKVTERTEKVEHQKKELEREKVRSDKLLLNILPSDTAEELKKSGKTKARHFKKVSVLFLDIVGFTNIAERMSPQSLVDELDFYFRSIDHIISGHRLEKIKTIGDAYLAVGGMPENNEATPADVVAAALEIQDFMAQEKERRRNKEEVYFEVRIGIHTGPLVAGVVGALKFQFDIWGDTVNIAARMEQCSAVGKVNISDTTYHLVKETYRCKHRGLLDAKNKGTLDMYFVEPLNLREPVA